MREHERLFQIKRGQRFLNEIEVNGEGAILSDSAQRTRLPGDLAGGLMPPDRQTDFFKVVSAGPPFPA